MAVTFLSIQGARMGIFDFFSPYAVTKTITLFTQSTTLSIPHE